MAACNIGLHPLFYEGVNHLSYTNPKKSFVLYRNMRKHMAKLPREQQGDLLMAIMDYADCSAEGHTDADPILLNYPDMSPDTRMAFFFIADVIRMDTEKWLQKQRNYLEAARKRQEGKDAFGAKEASADAMQKYVQNLLLAGRQT